MRSVMFKAGLRNIGTTLTLLAISMLVMSQVAFAKTPDASRLLMDSDKARGGGVAGIVWQVSVETTGLDNSKDVMTVGVKSNGDDNLMEILTPASARGRKILMRGSNMWFSSPNVSKPVPISARQRLTGQASYGDIAATNYVDNYTATLLANDSFEGVPCYVLDLSAANKSVTYDKVKYWVAEGSGLAVKAEFYTLSGKHIKTATFKYENSISKAKVMIPFVSEMRIEDALNGKAVTTLRYSSVESRALTARDFQLN